MREITFRGKRVDDGEWVYGDLIRHYENQRRFVAYDQLAYTYTVCGINRLVTEHYFEVDPVTVGQYTGLKDKNDVEIYEGDICRIITNQMVSEEPFTIIWSEEYAQWFWKDNEMEDGFWTSIAKTCEIIGNIHDNPELLESGVVQG